jgi:hypothetical protein
MTITVTVPVNFLEALLIPVIKMGWSTGDSDITLCKSVRLRKDEHI